MSVEMVFQDIDADGVVLISSAPLLVIRGWPRVSVQAVGKKRGRSNSNSTRQTLCDRLSAQRGVKADTSMMSRFFCKIGVMV
jgi:hypothetical protein